MITLKAVSNRKVMFYTNDTTYPTLIKRDDNSYVLIGKDGKLTGDGFCDDVDVLKHFPNVDLVEQSL
jgi:hypothetical protein